MGEIKNFNNFCLLTLITIFFLLSPLVNSYQINKENTDGFFDINFDCSKTGNIINPYSEINCGPLPLENVKNAVNIKQEYQEIGINYIRTHDLDNSIFPCDISTIFPNQDADPALESNYDFSISDNYVTSIINAGSKVFYRLGESAGGPNNPPLDFDKWAEICKHITMHYNDGWKDGFHYNIEYWEIWNEPDLKGFWNGTADQYYKLYEAASNTLKQYNSSLNIGGPCTSSVYNENFTTRFLDYVVNNSIALDFYSWHMYADSPSDLSFASKLIRGYLDSYGLVDCENINTEWNINILTPQRDKDNAKNAAFTSSCLNAFQDSYLDKAFRYRGNQDNNWLARLIGFDLSLFSYDGIYKKPALSYLAMHYMVKDTPIRIKSEEMQGDNQITYIAGISEDKSNITVIISNFESENSNCNLVISNLPWSSNYKAVHYLIDEDNDLKISKINESFGNRYSKEITIKKTSVHFIRLTNSDVLPSEGPKTADIPLILQLKFLDPFTRILGILIFLLIFDV